MNANMNYCCVALSRPYCWVLFDSRRLLPGSWSWMVCSDPQGDVRHLSTACLKVPHYPSLTCLHFHHQICVLCFKTCLAKSLLLFWECVKKKSSKWVGLRPSAGQLVVRSILRRGMETLCGHLNEEAPRHAGS